MPLAALALLFAGGCGNRGAKIARRLDQKVVAKIESGEIRSLDALETVRFGLFEKVLREMGIDPGKKPDSKEWDDYTRKLKKYEPKWKTLIREKWQ